MRITQEEVVDRQTVLNIELEDEDLGPYLDQGYRKVVQRVVIPGFRKGKAPRSIIENYYGKETLLNEVLDTMLPQVTGLAIQEQEIEMSGMPDIELVELDPLTVRATVPLRPEVDLGAYRDIRVEEEGYEVTEEDIQEQLEQMRQSVATWEPVERGAQIDDMATISVKGEVDGEPIIDESDVPFVLVADNPSPVPGFSDEIVGMEIDVAKAFTIAIPDDFQDTNLAGKEVKFEVTISDLKERNLPELDDELAKSVSDEYETLEELRKNLEDEIKTRKENESKSKYQEDAIQAILDSSTVELPPVLVDHETSHMEEERNNAFARMNIRIEDYLTTIGKTEEDMRNDMREEALERIKRTLVLAELAEKESIEVGTEEIDARFESLFADHEEDEEDHEGHDHTITDEMRSSMHRMLLSESTINRLVAIAKGEAPQLPEAEEAPPDDTEESEEKPRENTESENSAEGGDTDESEA